MESFISPITSSSVAPQHHTHRTLKRTSNLRHFNSDDLHSAMQALTCGDDSGGESPRSDDCSVHSTASGIGGGGDRSPRTSGMDYPKQDLQRPVTSVQRERQEFKWFCGFSLRAQHHGPNKSHLV